MTPTPNDRDEVAVGRLRTALDDLVAGLDAAPGAPSSGAAVDPDRRPRGRALVLAAAAVVLVAGVGVALARSGGDDGSVTATDGGTAPETTTSTAPSPTTAAVDPAVRRAALDMVLPVDGIGARRTVEVTVALDLLARDVCGIPGHGGMVLGHRSEVDVLPDLEDVRARGLVTPVVDEAGVVSTPPGDQPCYDAAIPEYREAFEVAVTWVGTEVRPLPSDPAAAGLVADAEACTRAAFPGNDDVLVGVTGLLDLATEAQTTLQGEALEQRSFELGEVFVDCTGPYYAWQREQLVARRAAVEATHADLVDRLAERLVEAGYTPSP